MSRSDMLKEIRGGNYYMDDAFINDYCRYFADLDDEGRKKLLGQDNCIKIGDELERRRRYAYRLIEEGKMNVEWPGGYVIKQHPPGRSRLKWDALVKTALQGVRDVKGTCIKMINEFLGVGNPITRPPREDKRTTWENRQAESQKSQDLDQIPF